MPLQATIAVSTFRVVASNPQSRRPRQARSTVRIPIRAGSSRASLVLPPTAPTQRWARIAKVGGWTSALPIWKTRPQVEEVWSRVNCSSDHRP